MIPLAIFLLACAAVYLGTIEAAFSALMRLSLRLLAEAAQEAKEAGKASLESAEQEGIIEGEERRLLQSIVDFGDPLVREVMPPRPDIVAIPENATVGDLRRLFREQEYSRFPVYKENLDNIAGFIFIKDLVLLDASDEGRPIRTLIRPAVVVPETKLVSELLKQFQRQ